MNLKRKKKRKKKIKIEFCIGSFAEVGLLCKEQLQHCFSLTSKMLEKAKFQQTLVLKRIPY